MELAKNASKLSVVLPPISPVGGAPPPLSMEVDPMTPRVASMSDSAPYDHDGTDVPVVTPIAAPPALRLTEAQVMGVPSAPSMSSNSEQEQQMDANETQEAAVLLTALSAIATKEVHVDGVTDLLSFSSGSSSRPIPPLPDLGKRKPQQPQTEPRKQSPAPIFRSLCTAVEIKEKADERQRTMQDSMRSRTVSIDAVMGVASDLSLPCEPCYRESDDENEVVPETAAADAEMQLDPAARIQGPSFALALAAEASAGGGANLISPPSSPAFRPRNANRGNSSPRSADRRKRFLDLHGTDCAAFQLPSSPPTSPITVGVSSPSTLTSSVSSSSGASRRKLEGGELPASHQGTLQPIEALRGRVVRIIVRKKFSWKNYPELERFLIANREEYLRHSALNYTVQQKRYNNRLTERLLQLATEHAYVFDESDFSFVTVRDRIRCYFKSYVQSSKKRGLVVGYAARRAGLLTRDELERSAVTAGRIVVPGKEAQA